MSQSSKVQTVQGLPIFNPGMQDRTLRDGPQFIDNNELHSCISSHPRTSIAPWGNRRKKYDELRSRAVRLRVYFLLCTLISETANIVSTPQAIA
jgi:hypothetical protein